MPSSDAPVPRALRLPPGTAASRVTVDAWTILAGAVAILASLAVWRDPALDQALFRAVNDLGPAAPSAWSALSLAGLGLSAWIYLGAGAERQPARVAQLLWILVVGGLVIHFIKHGFHAPRPLGVLGEAGMNVIGSPLRIQSMPSGHSAMAFAMVAILRAERRRFDERSAVAGWWLSTPALWAWTLLAVAIALSRLAVGAHWPADALMGAGLGLVFGGLAPHAWPVAAMTRVLARPVGQRLMALGFLACAVSIGATPFVLHALDLESTTFAKRVATGYPLAQGLQAVLALLALAGAVRWWRASRASTDSRAGGLA